ncbi:MAG: hypothetical protein Q9166_007997 [cf. Caloplaca sp. 2 TL-2023]
MAHKYGERLLSLTLDEIAKANPHRLYAVVPNSQNLSDGFRDISFGEVAHCVDNFVGHLEDAFGWSEDTETIAYLGIPDLRNAIAFLTAVKCGYKVLFLSPRNTPATNAMLLKQTICVKLIHTREMAPLATELTDQVENLKAIQIAELDDLLKQKMNAPRSRGDYSKAMNTPILILHSSGSTGAPKPITMTNGTFATFDYCRNLLEISGRKRNDFSLWDSKPGRKFYSAFPPSHLGGFLSQIIIPIFSEASSPVLGPPLRPPSAELVREIMEQQRLRSLFIPPALAEQILQSADGVEFFKGLDFMYTAGGPLSQSAGDLIARATVLVQLYGSTETSHIPQLVPQPEDWEYMEWHPAVKYEMRAVDSDDAVRELVLHMDSGTEKTAALNHNIPGAKEYSTRDLFKSHPTKPGLWRFHGRKDDIIVLSNSEKIFPIPMETKLSGHPLLSGAVVIGQGRFQPALLVETKEEVLTRSGFLEQLWPAVEEANALVPGQGRVIRSRILLASKEKPFVRAAKGTIVRNLTEVAYKDEIEALYKEDVQGTNSASLPSLKPSFENLAVETWIRSIVCIAFPAMSHASNEDDMFVLGLDSLKSMELTGLLKSALSQHRPPSELQWLSLKVVYSNPTIRKLANTIAHFLNTNLADHHRAIRDSNQNRAATIKDLVDRYTQDFSVKQSRPRVSATPASSIVAVTGTTGSLGMQLVQALSSANKVSTIVCLDRNPEAQSQHEGLKLQSSKMLYFTVSLDKQNLGLNSSSCEFMADKVDIFIHNAWKVDFNLPLQSFEDSFIYGLRTIIDFSLKGRKCSHLVFISSTSSISGLPTLEPYPEAPVLNSDAPGKMGYAESKFVAEAILARASEVMPAKITIARVGQIAGSTRPDDSPWSAREWFPSLLTTSKSMQMLPDNLPPLDWLPIDKVASAVVELALGGTGKEGLQVYNLVNPTVIPCTSVIDVLKEACGPNVQMTSLKDWITRLNESKLNAEELKTKPALKMLDFLSEMAEQVTQPPKYSTERSRKASPTMRDMKPVDEELIGVWLKQWGFL